jgi:hypothetical protein
MKQKTPTKEYFKVQCLQGLKRGRNGKNCFRRLYFYIHLGQRIALIM